MGARMGALPALILSSTPRADVTGYLEEVFSDLNQLLMQADEKFQEGFKNAYFFVEGKYHPDQGTLNELEDIYNYLALCLYWEIYLLNDAVLRKRLLNFLITYRDHFYSGYDFSYLPKSHMALEYGWILEQPNVAYYEYSLYEFRTLLSTIEPEIFYFNDFIDRSYYEEKLIKILKRKIPT